MRYIMTEYQRFLGPHDCLSRQLLIGKVEVGRWLFIVPAGERSQSCLVRMMCMITHSSRCLLPMVAA